MGRDVDLSGAGGALVEGHASPGLPRAAQRSATRAAAWLRDGRRVVAATLVAVEGSAPLTVGASLYVNEDGEVEGSITGGCVEGAVVEVARTVLAEAGGSRTERYGISDGLADRVGLTCGGVVHVLIREVVPADRSACLAALDALATDQPAGTAVVLDGDDAGRTMFVDEHGRTVGDLGASALLKRNVARELRGLIDHGRSETRSFGTDGSTLGVGVRVHLAARSSAPRMVIIGAIDHAVALAVIARTVGWAVTIADPRSTFIASPRFAAVAEVVVAWPQRVLEPATLGARDAVLVFSHDPKIDVPAVAAALASGAGYVGALGSRRTTADRRERLLEAGVEPEDLQRLRSPCGLDVGAATVEETALAVLAEIVAVRAGRRGEPLRETDGPIRPR